MSHGIARCCQIAKQHGRVSCSIITKPFSRSEDGFVILVEIRGFEPLTSYMRSKRSPN